MTKSYSGLYSSRTYAPNHRHLCRHDLKDKGGALLTEADYTEICQQLLVPESCEISKARNTKIISGRPPVAFQKSRRYSARERATVKIAGYSRPLVHLARYFVIRVRYLK